MEGQRRGLDGDGGRRAGGFDAVQLKLPAVQHGVRSVAVPVLPDNHRLDGEAGGGEGFGALLLVPGGLQVLGAGVGRLPAVLDGGPAVGDAGHGDLRAVGQGPQLPKARTGAGADVQADIGGYPVQGRAAPFRALWGGGGRRLDGVVEPLGQPDAVPVLELDLQIVRLVLLVVGVGQGEEVGADGGRDVRAAKGDLRRGAAGLIGGAHPAACFQGGREPDAGSAASGMVRTMPAGKV